MKIKQIPGMMLLAMLLSSGVASAQIHVKGNVYGGGELGKVTENTTVTVNDGTVGEIQYARKQGTASTDPFDTIIHVNESGHVYGGGKGSATDSLAGWVQGNTYVTLTGGHVQFNIYGGGELGSVGLVDTIGSGENMDLKPKQKNGKDTGVAYVKVTGGQVGPTPRTDAGYNLPCSVFGMDGYVIGGSKGVGNESHDYKAYANVNYTYDTIQMKTPITQDDSINHRIWGSVYGGGEDGHVLGNTTVVYMSGLCGPDGNVAYGGNVFGGGRNYHNRYETCGRVRGNTSVEVKGGSMLGSVFGGGRSGVTGVDYKGDTLADNGSQIYGHTFVVISGGTIGNEKIIASSSRTCGDVFGSGKGYVSNIDLGKSKYTNVTITNSAEVLGSVYGGGELGTVLKNTSVVINNGTTKGSVYGGAKGSADNELAGSVKGNTLVTMTGGTVESSIYGGGELGSVGTFTYNTVTYPASDPNNNAGKTVQIPTTCTAGGLAKVVIKGGSVGKLGSHMSAGTSNANANVQGFIICGAKGLADSITYPKAIGLGVVDSTYLEIRGTMATGSPTITASVFGGSENGLVLGNTHVLIGDSCQIGTGHYMEGSTHKWDVPYTEDQWTAAINAVKDGTITTELSAGHSLYNKFHECDAWPYGDGNGHYYVYDIFADQYDSQGGNTVGSNGHSDFGNVYGGGSGFYPIRPGIWRRTAGQVNGNTTVEITGGHILTNVYGGNEITSVNGTCHVIMSGGTVGIPRTKSQIEARPTNGYIFGAGMGDARTAFNTWTNVDSTYVSVTGGVVFSSVYGGGEEGHVLRNTHVTLNETDATNNPMIIGTIGYTEFDGNVFGAGRGMARLALTAGTIGGNSQVDIMAGTVLGSIYGGGSMASVGTYLVAANDTHYGEMQSGNGHGFTTINITGGTIGNDYEAVYHTNLETLAMGGNVYGGSKGSFTKLNSSEINPIWLNLAKVKRTSIVINGASVNIKGNVYGGGEYGTVTDSTVINVSNGTIWRDVFGGGHGSDNITVTQGLPYTPLQHAGRVYGNTRINISGGWIKKCIYGGGELASVGTVNNDSLTTLTQSWPIRFEYGTINGTSIPSGKTTINVTGGRIGMTGKDYFGPWDSNGNPVTSSGIAYANDAALKDACSDNGDIYGGSKGKAIDPNTTNHDHLYLANVRKTEINVDYGTSNTAAPTNYNPTTGDAGITNSNIGYATGFYPTWTEWTTSLGSNAERSCITGAVYAGAEEGHVYEDTKVTLTNGLVGHAIYGGGKGKGKFGGNYNLNAGKVYGNTEININNGYVVRSVFGGGNLASVGKGNYIGLTNGESQVHGADSIAVANSGITTINITGGQLGMLPFVTLGNGALDSTSVFKDNIPYGSVFGGCRGQVVNSTDISDDFFAFVNKTNITIDTAGYDPSNNPRIFGSVYGGGQDGHVRHNTYVTVNAGEIGVEFVDPNTALTTVGARDWTSSFWNTRGNVYGGGSGISKKSGNYSPIAGSVHDSTNVTINGGLIHRIVYGGGSMASVDSLATVTVNSPIGVASNNYHDYTAYDYGGYVFGGGRGSLETGVDLAVSAYTGRTKVNIGTGAVVPGNVYGGGAMGQVKDSTDVNMTDGEVKSNVFGGGKGADTHQNAGLVIKNTHVTLSDGNVGLNIYGGGEIASVGQVDNNGAPVDHTGFAKVDINGGTVGNSTMYNSYNANNNPDQHGHVYGGGKGIENDASSQTNPNGLYYNYANVNNTQVTVDAGRIYGSVYGGSAYGHVIDSTHVIITGNASLSANIGNKAITGWDGHVFGGGKGNSGNFTMGRVGGNTLVEMDHGTVKGCVYGGGRIALTGVGLNNGFEAFLNTTTNVYDSLHHGRTKVVVSGGVIGNADGLELLMSENKAGNIYGGGRGKTDEYIEDDLGRVANAVVNITGNPTIYGSVFGGGQMANVGHWNNYVDWYSTKTGATLVTIQDNPSIGTELEFDHGYATGSVGGNTTQLPIYTLYDTINGVRMLGHTRTGNVFGGGQGSMRMNAGAAEGFEQGHCRTAEVSISGTPTIMSSVYGGSEQGAIWGDTKVVIAGGTIGQQNRVSDSLNPVIASNHTGSYSFGSVFGGSYGMDSYTQLHSNSSVVADTVNNYAGRVYGDTKVEIRGGQIYKNVYGGGDMATVVGDSYVTIANPTSGSGPEIGPLDGTGLNANVYGAGRGFAMDSTELRKAYANVDSTYVIIEGGKIYGSVFGGGADSHVLGSTSVTVHSGADIGTDGLSTWDGNIFGGGRNFFNVNNTNGRVEGNISVTMDGGTIQGTIFGGGRMALSGVNENGVFPTTSWPADKHGNVSINVSGGEIGNGSDQGIHLLTESDESVGDIFGAGKGDTKDYLDTLAGRVTNATINIYGSPRIHGAVFGGGEMASLGWWDNTGVIYDNTGEATITIGRAGENDNPVIGTWLELNPQYIDSTLSINEQHYDPSVWTKVEVVNGAKRVYHTCTGNVFGGCQGDVDFEDPNLWYYMGRSRKATVTVNGGTIMSDVYGGSEQGIVSGDTKVTINGGTIGTEATDTEGNKYIHGNIYGGGYGSDEPQEDTEYVMVFNTLMRTDSLAGRTFGNTQVDILGGTMRNNVFGGAAFAYIGTDNNANKGKTTVNIGDATHYGHTITGNVYGANNRKGAVLGDVTVNVNAGTLGAGNVNDSTITRQSDVFGGGLGELTTTCGNVTVNVDTLNYTAGTTIFGNVYGGSALGSVNNDNTDKTTVNILAGTLATHRTTDTTENNNPYYIYTGGNVFGGGLGVSGDANKGQVNGKVIINIGSGTYAYNTSTQKYEYIDLEGDASIMGSIYGCNNTGGSPQDSVTVNIYKTAHTPYDSATYVNATPANLTYAINNVFGGGNEANYTGSKTSRVNIINCDNSVERVFGGGNAAASTNVYTDILGGRFDKVFGGGNGERGTSYAANISGNDTLTIHGGQVNTFFVGSNENGTVFGHSYVAVDNEGPCQEINIDEFFCGGNYVDVIGDVNAIITCTQGMSVKSLYGGCNQAKILKKTDGTGGNVNLTVEGGVFQNVYGGSKGRPKSQEEPNGFDASIAGNVTLNVKGGTIDTIFGGSNIMGNVHGIITVNVSDAENNNCPLIVHNVYGGGRGAFYAPDSVIVAGVKKTPVAPIVNFLNGNITQQVKNLGGTLRYSGGNVFGGGFGQDAYVTANPRVTIGYDPTTMSSLSNLIPVGITPHDTVKGNVYGGGQQAAVNGNTYVNIVKGVIGTADSLNTCPDINGLVFGGSEGLAGLGYHDVGLVRDTAFVTIGTNGGDNTATHVKGAVFGGGDDGQVGEAHVVVHSGTVGLPLVVSEMVDDLTNPVVIYRGNVYGGGRGIDTISTGTHYDSEEGRVRGNTSVTINGGKIYHDVYGAGSLGSVDKKAIVTVNGGEIGMSPDDALTAAGNKRYAGINSGQVFGSGRGVAGSTVFANFATVDSAVVNINGGTIYGLVFGGGANGHVKKSTVVTMTGGTIGIDENAVLGNDGAWYTYRGSLYGGGRGIDEDSDDPHHYSKTAGKVFGNTNVFVSGNSRIYHNVYGGGSIASVGDHNNAQQIDTTGNITVEITGGTIGVNGNNNGHVFGAGRGVPGSDFVKYNYVNHTNVHISDSALVNGSVFGGGENGHVYDSTQVIVSSGTTKRPTIGSALVLDELAEGVHIYRGNVYGGGKGTDTLSDGSYSNTAGWVRNKTSVIVNGGKIYHNVYGGGSLASVGADSITNSGLSKVVIAGGEIGMNDTEATLTFTPTGALQDTTIDFSGINNGQVFGGGRGEIKDATHLQFEQMAYVKNTQVTVNNGNIYGAVFGGGANGHVRNNTKVLVAGGTIGHAVPVGDQEELAHDPNIIYYGNVYGGGRGIDHNTSGGLSSTAGLVKGNTEVEVTGGTIYHCVYGGGSLANVGEASNENSGLAKVTVTGGTIGTTGKNNGSVFGGARGEAGGVYTDLAYVKNTQVVIGEKNGSNNALTITGSVFGGGANGHVRKNTDVKLYSGTIGTPLTADEMVEADPTLGTTRRHLFRGNVYGGGRGVDHDDLGSLSASAGRVYGNTNITILGGKVYHNVYGGGSLASVGTYTESTSGVMTFTDNTGHAEITIKGGEIGMSQADASAVTGSEWGAGLNSGQVYGSGRGETGAAFSHYAFTNTTHVTIDSAALVYGAVFGGGANGHVHDSTYVEVKGGTIGIDDITGGGNHFSIYRGNVYGGGRGIDLDGASHVSPTAGQVYGNTRVEISNGGNSIPKIWHNVYGGGSLATVGTYTGTGSSLAWVSGGKTTINISGGVVGEDADNNGRVFGSGRGYAKFDTLTHVYTTYVNILNGADVRGCVFGSGDNGHVYGDAHVIMTGGSVGSGHGGPVNGNLFGGGRGVDMTGNSAHPLSLTAGMVRGDTYVTMSGGSVKNNIYGGGYMASVYGSTHVDVGGTATVGDDANTDPDNGKVFGASRGVKEPYTGVFSTPEYAKIKGNTNVNITGGTIKNNIYGGGLLGAVGDTAKVTLTGVHYTNKNIFGAGQGEDNVDLDKTNADVGRGTVVILDNSTLTGSVYGGGEHGSVGIPYTTSGGKDTPLASVTINNVQISGAVYGGGLAAAVDGDAAVNVNHSAAVIDSVYGGCQTQGVVTGDIAVNFYNGQVNYNVFGGGYGKDTRTGGNVTVTLGQNVATHTDLPKINGDLYGGSAFGNVNDASATTIQTTTLNVLNGTVEGNVYGGGLGRRGATGIEPIAAKVNGEVHVNIGRETSGTMEGNAQLKGNIFGCNNVYGSPQKNTYVDVFKTYMVLTDSVNYSGTNPTYAIDTVFGGGNHADYTPENGLASSKMKARVHIHSCDNSINTLFGAGNAAAAVGDSAVIDGGRIDFVFGGGNGVLQAANIGAGGVSLALHGGNINKYFGGSNHNGTIAGPINLVVDNSRCGTVIDEFFCGGNEAPISGDVITTIECDPTSLEVVTINNLYGGCNRADISGNVELTVKGGRFINIYGGSKGRLADPGNGIVADSANIGGNVTLTMLGGQVGGHFDTFDTIGNIFGGSNILGNIKGKITVNILDTITNGCGFNLSHANVYGGSNLTGYKPTNPKLASPEVNVMHGTVLNVYGGSKGVANDEASGKVVANPVVTIGDRLYPQYQDRPANVQKITFKGQNIGGNVYGGGNAGDVDGNTTVILDGASKVYVSDDVFGGGSQAEVKGNAKVEVK